MTENSNTKVTLKTTAGDMTLELFASKAPYHVATFILLPAYGFYLGTIFHHGIDEPRDRIVSFCVPSIANLYLRWWDPLQPGANREPGAPEYTGDHLDGFGNKITLYAAANPDKRPTSGDKLTTRAAGFGIIRLNKRMREITMECWPRNVKISSPDAQQYPGWPRTISQTDNYGRRTVARLPTLQVNKPNALLKVINEKTSEWIYTIRIQGKTHQPNVFAMGIYTIEVGEGDNKIILTGIKAKELGTSEEIEVAL